MHKTFLVFLFFFVFANLGFAAEVESGPPPAGKPAKPRHSPKSKPTKNKPSATTKPTKPKPSPKSEPAKSKPVELCTGDIEFASVSTLLELFEIHETEFKSAPADVKCFAANAVACERFAGEVPADKEREEFLREALKQYCPAARSQLKTLKQKYEGRNDIQRILVVCEKDSQAVCATSE